MFQELVINFCTIATLRSGCNETLTAAGQKSNISQEMDDFEREFVKLTTKEAYDSFGRKNVEYSLKAASLANAIVTRSIQIKTQLRPFTDEIQCNIKPMGYDCTANWKWVLP